MAAASKKRSETETFRRKKSVASGSKYDYLKNRRKKKLKDKKMADELVSSAVYVLLGIFLALGTKQVLVYALGSEMPVVAVVSESMQHDNALITHYEWLEQRYGYSKGYINTWPVRDGFNIGDMPIVSGNEDYHVGDVIVYQVSGQPIPIIHRIVSMNEDGTYQTKGDNNMDQLPYEKSVSGSQIVGKVVYVIPKLGYLKVILIGILGVN